MTGFFGQEDEPSELKCSRKLLVLRFVCIWRKIGHKDECKEFPRVLKSYMGGDIYGTGR